VTAVFHPESLARILSVYVDWSGDEFMLPVAYLDLMVAQRLLFQSYLDAKINGRLVYFGLFGRFSDQKLTGKFRIYFTYDFLYLNSSFQIFI